MVALPPGNEFVCLVDDRRDCFRVPVGRFPEHGDDGGAEVVAFGLVVEAVEAVGQVQEVDDGSEVIAGVVPAARLLDEDGDVIGGSTAFAEAGQPGVGVLGEVVASGILCERGPAL